jgi:hypothetical protein
MALLASVGIARPARAEAPSGTETTWYGWQTLALDATAIALWGAAAAFDDARYASPSYSTYGELSDAAIAAGFVVYLLGPPLLHLGHGNGEKVATSLLLRLGLPIAGALVGGAVGRAALGSGGDADVPYPLAAGIVGFVAGGIAAMAIDAAVVARKPVACRSAPAIQPVVVPLAGGARFVLAGRF